MSTEALVCPSCRAPGAAGPDANDEYRCPYCGTQFRRTPTPAAATPVVVNVTAAQQHGGSPLPLVIGLVALLIGGGVAGAVYTMGSSSEGGPGPGPGHAPASVTVVAPTGPREAEQPTTISPRETVVAPAPAIVKPEPEAPASASFEFHRTQSGYQTSYYALGVVTNTSPFIIDKPKVIAVLLDKDGNELTTDFGFAQQVLGPGESSPIKILIKDPPEHTSVRYEVVPRKASYVPKLVEGLRVEPSEPRPAKYGDNRWELEGKVFNEGTQGAKFVEVEIQALDKDGKLVGIGSAYADGEVLTPGGMARYSNSSFMAAEAVDHFEFSVSGQVAQ